MAFARSHEQAQHVGSSSSRLLTNNKSPSGKRPTDVSFVQVSPILASSPIGVFVNCNSISRLRLAP
jgi:hypothetical protein